MHFLFLNQIFSLGNNVIARHRALFQVGNNDKMSTMNNESCISCICEPMAENCDEVCIITTHKYV